MTRRRQELRHPTPAPRDVAIGYCRPDSVDGAFAECLASLQEHDMLGSQRIRQRIYVESGPRISPARNRIVARMLLDENLQWLLMLDTDMTFTPDLLDRMLEVADPNDERPIIGALCFAGGRDFRIAPTIYVANPDAPPGELNLRQHLDYPENAVIRVHGTGAACILIHRSVFEGLYAQFKDRTVYPWFAETEIPPGYDNGVRYDGADIGEDITFSLRAVQAGFPIHVHTGIKVGHRKKVTLDEEAFLANRAHIETVGEDAARAKALRKIGVA